MEPIPARFALRGPAEVRPSDEGECTVALSEGALAVSPAAGPPLRVRLREIARWTVADYAVTLELESGARLVLCAVGKRLDAFCRALPAARVEYFGEALLLRERGAAAEESGEFRWRGETAEACRLRLQRTSLVVFPRQSLPFLVGYGEATGLGFDPEAYAVVLTLLDGRVLELLRFGKRTDALRAGLSERLDALAARALRALGALAPDLDALALRRAGALLRDGIAASHAALEQAAPGAWDAVLCRAFADAGRREAALHLAGRADEAWLAVKEVDPEPAGGEGAGVPEPPEPLAGAVDSSGPEGAREPDASAQPSPDLPPELAGRQVLYLFKLGRAMALEVPSSTESATYLFRAGTDPGRTARELTRALAAIQFRREPISLPDDALASGRGARYGEALRLVPELRAARAAFLGRAVHSGAEAWRKALEAALSRA